jgi:hypothetical protein
MTSLELITPLQLITPSVDVEFDPWLAQATHRDDVEAYYCLQPPREHVCMVTARRHSIEIDVNYTRLFPPPSPIAPALSNWIQREWKLDASKLAADPRNVLLLARDIERAYHQRRLTFEYDPFRRVLQLIVCDPTLLHEVAAPGVTDRLGITTKTFDRLLFADINHCIVQLPQDRFPYRRILQSHAARSWKTFGPEPPSSFSPRFASLIPHTKSSTPMLARHLTKFTATLKTPVASYLGNEEDAKDTGTIKEEKEYARRLPKMWMQPDRIFSPPPPPSPFLPHFCLSSSCLPISLRIDTNSPCSRHTTNESFPRTVHSFFLYAQTMPMYGFGAMDGGITRSANLIQGKHSLILSFFTCVCALSY